MTLEVSNRYRAGPSPEALQQGACHEKQHNERVVHCTEDDGSSSIGGISSIAKPNKNCDLLDNDAAQWHVVLIRGPPPWGHPEQVISSVLVLMLQQQKTDIIKHIVYENELNLCNIHNQVRQKSLNGSQQPFLCALRASPCQHTSSSATLSQLLLILCYVEDLVMPSYLHDEGPPE